MIGIYVFVLGTNHPHYFNAEQYSLDTLILILGKESYI